MNKECVLLYQFQGWNFINIHNKAGSKNIYFIDDRSMYWNLTYIQKTCFGFKCLDVKGYSNITWQIIGNRGRLSELDIADDMSEFELKLYLELSVRISNIF